MPCVAGGGCIHYELLTLANLLMLASPMLISRCEGSARVLKWFRRLTLTAALLVWSFIGSLFAATADQNDVKFGCYVWGMSFVILYLSVASLRMQQKAKVYV